jgi:hypothetical protein
VGGVRLILTALKAESAPIIQHFNLNKISASFPFYYRVNIYLAGTGMGEKGVSQSMPKIISFFKDKPIDHIINVGISGGSPRETQIGQLYQARSISKEGVASSFLLNKFHENIIELPLITVNREIKKWTEEFPDIVDMEAFHIIKHIREMYPLEKMTIIKVVSDYMDINKRVVTKQDVSIFIQKQMNMIETVILNG